MEKKYVSIKSGKYRNAKISGVFPLVKDVSFGKKGAFITVDASNQFAGLGNIRVLLNDVNNVEHVDAVVAEAQLCTKDEVAETKEQAVDRIRRRFDILQEMTRAVIKGTVRGLLLSGPPGVGKSFGVETEMEKYDMFNKLKGKGPKTEIVKGAMTPIGLYQTLYNNSNKGDVIVFDDCDSVLFDEVCLNMLKAVLDSGKKRTISWKSESVALRREGIPDRFEFSGSAIFISNVSFESVKSKKIRDHLEALMSRCHYIDLEMDKVTDKFLRIEQIVGDGMLDEYEFGPKGNQEIIDFMLEKSARLREISLRMVLKVADLRKMSPKTWKELAESTCMKRV